MNGSFTPEAALADMLAGTGVRARRVSAELIIVARSTATPDVRRTGGESKTERPFVVEASVVQADASAPMSTAPEAAAAPNLVEEVKVTGSSSGCDKVVITIQGARVTADYCGSTTETREPGAADL